jgi:predicted nucleic acid-binding protein
MFGLQLADAVVYATARRYGAEFYTSDEDLKGVKGVVFI